jgi:glutamine---fructose-6-phosphate transaminase (isomerizing)
MTAPLHSSASSLAFDERKFAHVMLREIYEQPKAIAATLEGTLAGEVVLPAALTRLEPALRGCEKLIIAASGSSRNAGLAGEIMIEELSGVAVDVEYASEYCDRSTGTAAGTVVMVISQSGETADAMAALQEARRRGAETLGLTNVPDSTMAREAGAALLTRATPELAVPATKSFTTQLCVLHLFALSLARLKGRLAPETARAHREELNRVPGHLGKSLDGWNSAAREAAGRFHAAQSFLFIGRGVHYAIAREGALKLKEISYLPAEGFPAGELLHGPNALVSGKSLVVALAACDRRDGASLKRYEKTLEVLKYVKGHGGRTVVIATEGDDEAQAVGDATVFVPPAPELLLPLLEVVPLQLFAYHVGVLSGCDVDHPRNLVKAVVRK